MNLFIHIVVLLLRASFPLHRFMLLIPYTHLPSQTIDLITDILYSACDMLTNTWLLLAELPKRRLPPPLNVLY